MQFPRMKIPVTLLTLAETYDLAQARLALEAVPLSTPESMTRWHVIDKSRKPEVIDLCGPQAKSVVDMGLEEEKNFVLNSASRSALVFRDRWPLLVHQESAARYQSPDAPNRAGQDGLITLSIPLARVLHFRGERRSLDRLRLGRQQADGHTCPQDHLSAADLAEGRILRPASASGTDVKRPSRRRG